MSVRKVKTPAKMFTSDLDKLESIIVNTVDKISNIVGSSLGPGGRNVIIESDLPGIPNKNTKDGVSIFRALGSYDPYEHLIIEQIRDVAVRTVNEAGDGTTSATIIAASLIKNLFHFCKKNKKFSPQKVARIVNKYMHDIMIPFIDSNSIKITMKNRELLERVATVSTNGDSEMAKAVMQAFELTGFSSASHVTIQELSGPSGKYEVDLVEGFPVARGYEESIGKFHPVFINDQGHQRCVLENPLFILFDGKINDYSQIHPMLLKIGEAYVSGQSDFKNVVIVAHNFSEQVLNILAGNFPNPATINVVPLKTPISQIINSELNFLMDLSAFTGAKIFNMQNPLDVFVEDDWGNGVEKIEIYRFRTTIVGNPDETLIEARAEELRIQMQQSESKIEKILLDEQLGKLTSGIAQLKLFGSSNGELKEKADRAEDAVCAVRASINHGCLPGGCRVLINLALEMSKIDDPVVQDIIIPSLHYPFYKLLENAGYSTEHGGEIQQILTQMIQNTKQVYDVENGVFGDPKKLGIYDATAAVKQALINAVSISSVMGLLGGIICQPRDGQLERQEATEAMNFERTLENANNFVNEANERG
jgi:chaperonin GroEL